jgi:DNA-directed RNA polymerase specialized sigma24 family protein
MSDVNPESSDPVESLAAVIREGRTLSSGDVEPVALLLRRWLSKRRLIEADLDETIAESLARLVSVVEAGSLDAARPAGAWLRVVADHLAVDMIRRHGRREVLPFDETVYATGSDDDALARLLDASAAASDVRRALQMAQDQGQTTVVRVVTVWLGLAEANGEPPGSRDVAERIGVSHMTVQRALNSFAALIGPS